MFSSSRTTSIFFLLIQNFSKPLKISDYEKWWQEISVTVKTVIEGVRPRKNSHTLMSQRSKFDWLQSPLLTRTIIGEGS